MSFQPTQCERTKRRSLRGALAVAAILLSGLAPAELYRVTVSREASNLYRVEYSPSDVYIKTRYCYVYCYYEDAVVDTDDMVIHFLDSDEECDIAKLLTE